jgi:hypothetical protein
MKQKFDSGLPVLAKIMGEKVPALWIDTVTGGSVAQIPMGINQSQMVGHPAPFALVIYLNRPYAVSLLEIELIHEGDSNGL